MVLACYELGIDRQKGMVMSAQRYSNVSQLRELLLGMEWDLGLGKLTQNEKDVFHAVHWLSRQTVALHAQKTSKPTN